MISKKVLDVQLSYFKDAILKYREKFGLDGAFNSEIVEAEQMYYALLNGKDFTHDEKERVLGSIVYAVGDCFTWLYSEDDEKSDDVADKVVIESVKEFDDFINSSVELFKNKNSTFVLHKLRKWTSIVEDVNNGSVG